MNRLVSGESGRPSSGGRWKEKWLAGTLLLLLLAMGQVPLWGIEGNEPAPLGEQSLGKALQNGDWDRNAPVDIHSEEMSVDFENNKIVFKGDVKVLQSDFSLTAGEVTAVFGESADDIKKIIASDDVKIQKADKMAWGDQAVYDRGGATILLTGSPVPTRVGLLSYSTPAVKATHQGLAGASGRSCSRSSPADRPRGCAGDCFATSPRAPAAAAKSPW